MRQAEEQAPACLSQEAVLTFAACPAYQLCLGWSHEPVVEKLIISIPSLPEMLTVTNTQAGKMSAAESVAVLTEDERLVPNTHVGKLTTACNSNPRGS